MRRINILIAISVILWSCSNTKDQNANTHQLIKDSNTEFYVGPTLYPSCKSVHHFHHNGQELLAYVNRGIDILFFSITEQKLIHEINYDQNGPNKVSSIRGLYVHNMDSILLLTSDPNILILSDSTGNILKRIKVPLIKNKDCISMYVSNVQRVNNPVVEIDFKLYFSTFTNNSPVLNESLNTSMGISYSFVKDTVDIIDIFYPNSIDFSHDGSWVYSREYANKKWIYSFIYSNKIMEINENGNIRFYPSKSKFAGRKQSFKGVKTNNHFKEILKPRYSSIIYDKWRDVFYRIFLTEIDFKRNFSDEDYFDLIENPPAFSVLILSKNLDVIGETLMPERYYNPEMCFIDKSGIHFALHPNHPEFDPDYLKFTNFIIKPISKNQ